MRWFAITERETGDVQFVQSDEGSPPYDPDAFAIVAVERPCGPDDSFDGAAVAIDVGKVRARCLAALKTRRDRAQDGGCPTPSGLVDSDEASRGKISGAVQMAMIAQGAGAPFQVEWTMHDNSTVMLNAGAMIQMGVAVGQHVTRCHAIGVAKRQQLLDAATIAELDAIDLEEGWPDA